jgi:hypothetical protein
VCNKVVAGRSVDCVLLEGMATAMDPDVDHNLGMLVEHVVQIEEFPLGVGCPPNMGRLSRLLSECVVPMVPNHGS